MEPSQVVRQLANHLELCSNALALVFVVALAAAATHCSLLECGIIISLPEREILAKAKVRASQAAPLANTGVTSAVGGSQAEAAV